MPTRTTGHGTTLTAAGFDAMLTAIRPPGATGEPIDATHLGTDDVLDFLPPDLPNAGQMEVRGFLDPSQADPVIGQTEATSFVIEFRDGATWTFDGLWTAYEPEDATTNEMVRFSATIQVTSTRVFAAGS